MNRCFNEEILADRARDLQVRGLNGSRLVFVSLEPTATPPQARLDLEFYNANSLAAIDTAVNGTRVPPADDTAANGTRVPPTDIFMIRGGSRIRGGKGVGEVQVTAVTGVVPDAPNTLRLLVAPIGDYSTYTLTVHFNDVNKAPLIDPLFASIDFKFRPGCFNLNCAPVFDKGAPPLEKPVIDYLAKDFDSFKHVLINAMRERVPDWQPTSEADLDQVIIDLLAADADELSDFQDRVMNEAYLGLARKRVSLARHGRLLDYHIHQGNQASTWLAVEVSNDCTLPAGCGVWSGAAWEEPGAVIFVTDTAQACLTHLNRLELYTWGGAVTALDAGATAADIALPAPLSAASRADADTLCNDLRRPGIRYLVIEEKLNPETGTVNGRDVSKRQFLRLLDGEHAAEALFDPVAGAWFVRVCWRPEDRLQQRYCFMTDGPDAPPVVGVSAFHGNLVHASHGRPHQTVFRPPGSTLAASDDTPFVRFDEAYFEPTDWGVVCTLPHAPLAYRNTPPGGDTPTRTTLNVTVSGGVWQEQIDLIESQGDDEHFIVETDELGASHIRFGNGVNGMVLDSDAVVTCDYQIGRGSTGNVGADSLTGFDSTFVDIVRVWNPFDVTDGRDPESPAEIIRRVPQAYSSRQLRAITLADYVQRAEELPQVAHAYARYAWTGSWRTVQVSIDPAGVTDLDELSRRRIAQHLDAVRLIGEDLEVRPARYVALDIKLRLCAHPDFWPEDLITELDMEFSDGYTADGRRGFFHPDAWTFGQPLHASQLIGRALSVRGVERVLSVSMRRWNAGTGPTTSVVTLTPADLPEALVDTLAVEPFEVIQVANDPNHLERGRILFDVQGGRQ